MNAQGIIRKISIGDIKEGITYKVGQEMLGGRITIEQIIRNLDNPDILQYDVFVSEKGADIRLWKSFFNEPTAIEYYIRIFDDEGI